MLSPEVYNKLYQYASNASHSNVLEIGAAHGASTIALALGLKESQYDNTVISIEKGEGGSRTEYGSKERNLEILRRNLSAYDIDELVSIVPERLDIERGVPDIVRDHAPYSLLCIDADG